MPELKVKSDSHTMHRLRTPNEAFFHRNPEILGMGRQIGSWSIWVIFSQTISTHFGTLSPLSMFSNIQPLFLQKTKPLYQHHKYLFELFAIGI